MTRVKQLARCCLSSPSLSSANLLRNIEICLHLSVMVQGVVRPTHPPTLPIGYYPYPYPSTSKLRNTVSLSYHGYFFQYDPTFIFLLRWVSSIVVLPWIFCSIIIERNHSTIEHTENGKRETGVYFAHVQFESLDNCGVLKKRLPECSFSISFRILDEPSKLKCS